MITALFLGITFNESNVTKQTCLVSVLLDDDLVFLAIDPKTKRLTFGSGIIMMGLAWPAALDLQILSTSIDQAVSELSGNQMDASWNDFFTPGFPVFVHQHQQSLSGLSQIDFITAAVLVPVPAGQRALPYSAPLRYLRAFFPLK